MLCAEDELGIGESHEGILVLPQDTKVGTPAVTLYPVYTDYIYEIGLTPNRMDAQSHMGVARDVTAYLTRHNSGTFKIKLPSVNGFKPDNQDKEIDIQILNPELCLGTAVWLLQELPLLLPHSGSRTDLRQLDCAP